MCTFSVSLFRRKSAIKEKKNRQKKAQLVRLYGRGRKKQRGLFVCFCLYVGRRLSLLSSNQLELLSSQADDGALVLERIRAAGHTKTLPLAALHHKPGNRVARGTAR